MIFTKIELENFGIFRGKHLLNLDPLVNGSSKPIVIFGGKNGSGKTTILEAIRLCLYGEQFKGSELKSEKFTKYLFERFNRYAFDHEKSPIMSVCVEFKYGRFGEVENFRIKRSWAYVNDKLEKKLLIYQNGELLKDLYKKQWKSFIKELVPLGLSKLFFFDGEQIQSIAEEESDTINLVNSIQSLLGLDIVERLQADLRLYLSRKIKIQNQKLAITINQIEQKQCATQENFDSINQEKAKIQTLLDRVNVEIEDYEHKIAIEGGDYASKREELKISRDLLKNEINEIKNRMRKLCSNLLPFSLIPDLCYSLQKRLISESEKQENFAAKKRLELIGESISCEMNSDEFWKELIIPLIEREQIVNKVLRSFKNKTNNLVKDQKIIHAISTLDRTKLLDIINEASNQPKQMQSLTSKLEELTRQLQSVEMQLHRAPSNEVINPLIQKVNELYNEKGVLEEKHRSFETEVEKIKNELKRIQWELDKLLTQELNNKKQSEKLELAKKVQNALKDFVTQLRIEKIKDFSGNFLECFTLLSNKGDLIEKINVNLDNYQIELLGNKSKLTKTQLSAGEKQIFAIAMLWALARVSEKQLPFIIDTPLGRLDETHRKRIVERFFPNAGHQVILFSTDTEIDTQLFSKIQPKIGIAYHLKYDKTKKTSSAKPGYFWSLESNEVTLQ